MCSPSHTRGLVQPTLKSMKHPASQPTASVTSKDPPARILPLTCTELGLNLAAWPWNNRWVSSFSPPGSEARDKCKAFLYLPASTERQAKQ